jgi:hypothetical protein
MAAGDGGPSDQAPDLDLVVESPRPTMWWVYMALGHTSTPTGPDIPFWGGSRVALNGLMGPVTRSDLFPGSFCRNIYHWWDSGEPVRFRAPTTKQPWIPHLEGLPAI